MIPAIHARKRTLLMNATHIPCPFQTPGWTNEEKIDGWGLAVKEAGGVCL